MNFCSVTYVTLLDPVNEFKTAASQFNTPKHISLESLADISFVFVWVASYFFFTRGDKLCPEKFLSEDNKASVVGLIPCKSNNKPHTEMLRSVPFPLCVCKLVQCGDLHSLSLLYCVQCAGVWTHKGPCFQSRRGKPVGVPFFFFFSMKRGQKANLQHPCF